MAQLPESFLPALRNIVGEAFVFTEQEVVNVYAKDETEELFYPPLAVVKPRTAEEISAIL
ncbi:MAG: FAD-binding oxidoreductase, partial [Bacteroidetes bacterium]